MPDNPPADSLATRQPRDSPTPGDVVVEARGLSKRFGRTWAVNGLDFAVGRGRLFGLLGPNGAGKSTTMFMMAGLARPSGGSIQIFGRPPGDLRGVRARLGALIERPAFVPYLTARKNLELLARLNAMADSGAIDRALERLGLSEAADRKVGGFSQGMRQRLGLAQALQHDPELLILDEPTNGLDPEGAMEIWRLLREVSRSARTTILVSSHLLHEIEEHCTDVCVLDRGRAVAQGAVAELLADPHPTIEIVWPDRDQAERGRRWLEERSWAEVLRVETQSSADASVPSVVARVDRSEAARLNRSLCEASLAPTYLNPQRRTLRDFFLQQTGQGCR